MCFVAGLQAASEVLGACLVTQPKKLADKKSSFLRALRRESSEPNAETAVTSRVSPPPTLTADNTDKQVLLHLLSFSSRILLRGLRTMMLVLGGNVAICDRMMVPCRCVRQ